MDWKMNVETNDRYLVLSFPDFNEVLVTNLYDNCTMTMSSETYEQFRQIIKQEILTPLAKKLIANGILRFKNNQVIRNEKILRFPETVYWGLTDSCNLRCRYCYGCFGGDPESEKLDIETAYQIVDRLDSLQVKKINLTGGEASLHPNLFEIAEYIREKGISCGLLTNAQLITEKTAERYKVFDYVKVSLDSQYAEINDSCRGKGCYDSVLDGISLLKKNGISVCVGCVIHKYNYQHINSFRQWLKDVYGITDFYPAYLTPVGRGEGRGLDLSEEEISYCEEVLFRQLINDSEYRKDLLSKHPMRFSCVSTRCGMGMTEVFLNYKGDVYPCRATYEAGFNAGNLLKETPEKIKDRLDVISDRFDISNLACRSCDFRYLCSGGCRVYHKSYSGEWEKNSSRICKRKIDEICRSIILNSNIHIPTTIFKKQVISLY